MSTLTLLRHAQASFGADRYDALSPLGLEQAARLGEFLAERQRSYDTVWVGPRDRHRLTAKGALEPLGLDWAVAAEPALDEFAEGQQILASAQRHQGVALRGPGAVTGKPAARCYVREIEAWARGEIAIEGVRPAGEFRRGVAQWLAQAATGSGRRIVAVTSGGVISAIVAEALALPDRVLADFMGVIYNASITELAFAEGRPPSLVTFNAAGHLPDRMLTQI